jgi:hypothetical protein
MRHLYGVALAVLLAAAVYFGAAWGYQMVFDGTSASAAANSGASASVGGALPAAGGSLFSNGHVMLGGGLMLAVGLAAGLLMLIPWVSPLAAGLPGLVLVAWTGLYISDVREAVKLIPLKNHGFSTGFQVLLYYGLLGMFGLAMMVPLFIPSRWRRPALAPGYTAPGESVLAGRAPVSVGTGDPDLGGVTAGFATPSGGDSAVITDRTHTLPQRGAASPPDSSPAPWDAPSQD